MKYTRLRDMEEYILQRDYVSLRELCEVFNKSINTVRRDVAELLPGGTVEKVYGGVRAAKPPSGKLLSFTERTVKRGEEKKVIGRLAARFVREGDVIFLDSGTTTLHLIPHITAMGVTVLTNNLHALNASMEHPHLKVISFGGQLDCDTASLSANFCNLDYLRSFNVNKAFMAATGVSIERGATNSSYGELTIKKTIVENSDECFLLADTTKYGHSALLTYAGLERFQTLITDRAPPPEYGAYLAERGIRLLCADEQGGEG